MIGVSWLIMVWKFANTIKREDAMQPVGQSNQYMYLDAKEAEEYVRLKQEDANRKEALRRDFLINELKCRLSLTYSMIGATRNWSKLPTDVLEQMFKSTDYIKPSYDD